MLVCTLPLCGAERLSKSKDLYDKDEELMPYLLLTYTSQPVSQLNHTWLHGKVLTREEI